MEGVGLFKLLKISNEDILLSGNFKSLPVDYENEARKLLEIYLDQQQYEQCAVIRDYLDYISKLN